MIPKRRPFIPKKRETEHRLNRDIRVPEVRLVGEEIEPGVYTIDEALRLAKEQEVDLVEISPKAVPPVCRLVDYNKFLYDKKKKDKEIKAKQKKTEVKEIRFTPNTDDHDLDFKKKHAQKFLQEGSKVKIYVQFKGRAIQFKDRGELVLLQFAEALKEYGLLEAMPNLEGKKMIAYIAPKKNNILMKLLNKLLIIIIFILISNSIKAQFIPNTTFINTPYGNIPITTYYHMPIAYFNLGKKPTSINTKDYYTIKLKNDSTIKVYGEIDFSDSVNTFIIKEKRKIVRKIYPNETKYIIALGEKNLRVAGNPKDSCWVFQQTKDSVSLYSVVAEANEDYALFFSKNNGIELLVLNETNLLALVGDDEKLIKIIKKDKNYIKAIKKYNLKLNKKNE